jgi:phosphatidylinositol-4-phosphate 3-kinase
MYYLRKQEKLTVMVRHVKDLVWKNLVQIHVTHTNPSLPLQVPREGSDTADPYVKLYLLPDPNKSTKKKTKINKKTLNPTYNETVRYPYAQPHTSCMC